MIAEPEEQQLNRVYLRTNMRLLLANATDKIEFIWRWIECFVVFPICVWHICARAFAIPDEGLRPLYDMYDKCNE